MAYAHITKELSNKLGVKSLKTKFLGYDNTTKGFRCYKLVFNKIVISRDVMFNELQNGDFKSLNVLVLDHGFFLDLFPPITLDDSTLAPTTSSKFQL